MEVSATVVTPGSPRSLPVGDVATTALTHLEDPVGDLLVAVVSHLSQRREHDRAIAQPALVDADRLGQLQVARRDRGRDLLRLELVVVLDRLRCAQVAQLLHDLVAIRVALLVRGDRFQLGLGSRPEPLDELLHVEPVVAGNRGLRRRRRLGVPV